MNWEILNTPSHSLKRWKKLLNLSETVPENTFGPSSNEQTESGSDLTRKYSLKKEHNILIKRTSGPNTTTIRMMSGPQYSRETYSSITKLDFSPQEMDVGTLKENV